MGGRAGPTPPAVAGAAVALAGLIGGARALLWSGTPVVEVDADWFRCVEELTPPPPGTARASVWGSGGVWRAPDASRDSSSS